MTTERNNNVLIGEIGKVILKYCGKLSYEERLAMVIAIEAILESDQQPTVGLDRLMTLENQVLKHGDQLKTLADLDRDVCLVMDKHSGQQGQITELTEHVRNLHIHLARIVGEHDTMKQAMEEFAENIYRNLM